MIHIVQGELGFYAHSVYILKQDIVLIENMLNPRNTVRFLKVTQWRHNVVSKFNALKFYYYLK